MAKWHKLKDKTPKKKGRVYLIKSKAGHISTATWCGKKNEFMTHRLTSSYGEGTYTRWTYETDVVKWAKLPKEVDE